ncbi:MAG: hypothetical protein ACLFV7_08790 [Phycisphaerae bacterium]
MKRWTRTIWLVVLATMFASCPAAWADGGKDASPAAPHAPKGSVARQLDLRYKLEAASRGLSLASALNHSRQAWESLLPDERERIRKTALAILSLPEEKQLEVLQRYEKLIDMTAQRREAYERRAKMYKAVMDSLTAEERKELMQMSLRDRARKVLEIRDRLVAEGKLKLDKKPSTQPSDAIETKQPTTQPADR